MSGRRRYIKNGDFDEGDVWGVMEDDDTSNSINMMIMMKDHYSASRSIIPKSPSPSPSSAPKDIPDWSKIYGNYSSKNKGGMNVITAPSSASSSSWVDYHHDDGGDDDGDGHGMVPPHEFLAKKLERTQSSSFSVCEGIGRTLKGRDLRKVRNAILTRTGFLES